MSSQSGPICAPQSMIAGHLNTAQVGHVHVWLRRRAKYSSCPPVGGVPEPQLDWTD